VRDPGGHEREATRVPAVPGEYPPQHRVARDELAGLGAVGQQPVGDPDSRSTTAASSAIRNGWCSGKGRMLVPIRMRLVRAAMAAAATSGEGRKPSGVQWCSDSHTAW